MKKIIRISGAAILMLSAAAIISSCNKNRDTTTTPDDTATQTQNASDEARVNNELENATGDANTALSSTSSVSGRLSGMEGTLSLPCDVKLRVDSVNGILTLTYDDTVYCNGVNWRSGTIQIQLLNYKAGWKWRTPGATVQLTFNNYMVKRHSDSKTITFNGTKTIENVNGGLLRDLPSPDSTIVHKIRANNLTITFDDGTQRKWSVARTKTWRYMSSLQAYQISVSGDTTFGGLHNVVMWGTTRLNSSFNLQFTSPIVSNSVCGWYRPTSGVAVLSGISNSISETFGVNQDGTAYTGSTACGAYGYKFNWTNAAGAARQVVLPY